MTDCSSDTCITCGDVAVAMRVIEVDEARCLALCESAEGVREDCSPRHVPSEVYEVKEVPRTLSGKVLEVPVKKILTGTPPEKAASRDSLANPEALDWFVELAQKRSDPS